MKLSGYGKAVVADILCAVSESPASLVFPKMLSGNDVSGEAVANLIYGNFDEKKIDTGEPAFWVQGQEYCVASSYSQAKELAKGRLEWVFTHMPDDSVYQFSFAFLDGFVTLSRQWRDELVHDRLQDEFDELSTEQLLSDTGWTDEYAEAEDDDKKQKLLEQATQQWWDDTALE